MLHRCSCMSRVALSAKDGPCIAEMIAHVRQLFDSGIIGRASRECAGWRRVEVMLLDEFYFAAFLNSRQAGIYFLFVFLPLIFASACSAAASVPDLTPVTVQLSWTHQAEFAGFYAAEEQGYFQEEGLKVTFLEGGPEVDFIKPVTDGQAQFGIAQPADLILARAEGQPVRSMAVIFRRSPIVFFSLQDSGIIRPQDFVGRKVRTAVTVDQVPCGR